MGNDNLKLGYGGTKTISIHVPSWGTTHRDTGFNSNSGISIHVPSWGTTPTGGSCFLMKTISIHVPSWGTTRGEYVCGVSGFYFNPRSLVGNDLILSYRFFSFWLFQSTFPRGERQDTCQSTPIRLRFQSTFPRGERPGQEAHICSY